MNLNLEPKEVQFILQVLGEMPAKTGVWPLIVKIQEQAILVENSTKEI